MRGELGLVACVIAGIIAYAVLLDTLGFLICTFLLVAFYLKVIAGRRWLVSLGFAARNGSVGSRASAAKSPKSVDVSGLANGMFVGPASQRAGGSP